MTATFQGFRALIENSPDAISLINRKGDILYGSASTVRILGYQPAELVGRNCLDLIHPEDRIDSSRALKEALARPPRPRQWDARVRLKDGTYRWVESTVSNLLEESEVQAMVVQLRDINARKSAEARARQQSEELARCNHRLEEFVDTAAHDLKEPLRGISAFTSLLVEGMPMDAKATQIAEFIIDGAARMSALVDDLLTFARTGLLAPDRPLDLRHAVALALQNLSVDIQASGAIVTVGDLPVLNSKELHLVRLFQNLISNALKYNEASPPKIQIGAQRSGPDWRITVQDNGVGIARKDQTRVFQPFVRLAGRDVPGTGLGLALCNRIVEGLGGTLQVESAPGAGSTFSFTMPAAASPEAAETTASTTTARTVSTPLLFREPLRLVGPDQSAHQSTQL